MPTALLTTAAFAVCVALPISTLAKQPRSASVEREFQLMHPCPANGRTSGACLVTSRITLCRSGATVLMLSLTCSGRRSAVRRLKIVGKRKGARARCELTSGRPGHHRIGIPALVSGTDQYH